MKKITKVCLASLLALGMTFSASALDITQPADGSSSALPITAQAIADALGGGVTADDVGMLLYKAEAGDGEEGGLNGSYDTDYQPPGDPSMATITYTGGVVADATYLVVKDGTEGWYVWDISSWDGMETINISGVFVQHAISHISIWGSPGNGVPDAGGSLALLGMAVGLLGLIRRKK